MNNESLWPHNVCYLRPEATRLTNLKIQRIKAIVVVYEYISIQNTICLFLIISMLFVDHFIPIFAGFYVLVNLVATGYK